VSSLTSTSPAVRALAAQLRAACARRGLHLRDGAAEQFLVDRVRRVAALLRISERYAMRQYLTEEVVNRLVHVIADGEDKLRAAVGAASPLLRPCAQ
jgi:hypothetical protein